MTMEDSENVYVIISIFAGWFVFFFISMYILISLNEFVYEFSLIPSERVKVGISLAFATISAIYQILE